MLAPNSLVTTLPDSPKVPFGLAICLGAITVLVLKLTGWGDVLRIMF